LGRPLRAGRPNFLYGLSLLAWLASRCFMRFFIFLLRLDICPPSVAPQTLGLV
jgi:hypothetical protein